MSGPPPRPQSANRSRSPLRNYLLLLVTGFALVVSWDEIGFFIFLLIMGGMLSYLGDQLGSYCGKQRLSILGLRPKYTAGLINLATGLLITILTFGGAIYVSEDVRVAVFKVGELRRQTARVQAELKEAHIQNQAALSQTRQLEQEKSQLETEKTNLAAEKASLEEIRVQLAKDNEGLAGRNVELADRNGDLARSNEELEARGQELDHSIGEKLEEIDRLNKALEKKEIAPVVISRGQVLLEETAAVPLDVTTGALQEALGELTDSIAARVALLDVQFDDRAARFVVQYGVKGIMRRLKEIRDFHAAEVERGESTPEKAPKVCHIAPISTRNVSVGERLARIFFDVRPDVQVFSAGQEIARTVVDGALPAAKILDQLMYFDQQVRSVLRERGVNANVVRRGGPVEDPARLLELVRLADAARATDIVQVALCRAGQDIFAFGDPAIVYALEGAAGDAAGGAGDLRAEAVGPPRLDLDSRSLGDAGFELILPEPTLSADTLLQGGVPTLGVLPTPLPEGAP